MLRLSEIWGWGNCFSGRIDVNLGGGAEGRLYVVEECPPPKFMSTWNLRM